MSRNMKIIRVETRNRIALGNMARYQFYTAHISADGRVITLTGQVIGDPDQPAPPVKRARRKRAAPAAKKAAPLVAPADTLEA